MVEVVTGGRHSGVEQFSAKRLSIQPGRWFPIARAHFQLGNESVGCRAMRRFGLRAELGVVCLFEELQLLGKAENGPGQAAGPGAEGGITLLRIGTAILATVDVEEGLVRDAAPRIVSVPPVTIEDAIAGGGL